MWGSTIDWHRRAAAAFVFTFLCGSFLVSANAASDLGEVVHALLNLPAGGGVFVDVDGDRDGDLFLAGPDGTVRLLLNYGVADFKEAVEALPAIEVKGPSYLAVGDLDGDLDADLIVCARFIVKQQKPTCRLFLNRLLEEESLRFVEASGELGFSPGWRRLFPLLADYDGDRDLDIVLLSMDGKEHVLLRNDSIDGATRFVALPSDTLPQMGRTRRALILDAEGRGTELYLVNLGARDQLLVFDPTTDRFEDRTAERGLPLSKSGPHDAAVGDFDANRRNDLFIQEDAGRRFLFLQGPDGIFTDHTKEAGLSEPDPAVTAIVVDDFDRDRRIDLFLARSKGASRLLLNRESGRAQRSLVFVDSAAEAGVSEAIRASVAASFRTPEACDYSVHLFIATESERTGAVLHRFPDDSAGRTILAERGAGTTVAPFDGACVQGSDGADRLVGHPRTSILSGGGGTDTLVARSGLTIMDGGQGADRFETRGFTVIRLPLEDIAPGERIVCDPSGLVLVDSPLSRKRLEEAGVEFEGCFEELGCPSDPEAVHDTARAHWECHARPRLNIADVGGEVFSTLASYLDLALEAFYSGSGFGSCEIDADCYAIGLDFCRNEDGSVPLPDTSGQCYPSDFDGQNAGVPEWCNDPFWARYRFQALQAREKASGERLVVPVVFWIPRSSAIVDDQCTIQGFSAKTRASWHNAVAAAMGRVTTDFSSWGISFDYRIRFFTVPADSDFVRQSSPCQTNLDWVPGSSNSVRALVQAFPTRYATGHVNIYLTEVPVSGQATSSFVSVINFTAPEFPQTRLGLVHRDFIILNSNPQGVISHEIAHALKIGHPYDGNLVSGLGPVTEERAESRESWSLRPFPDVPGRLHSCASDAECEAIDAPPGLCAIAPGQTLGFCQNLKQDCASGGDLVCDTPWDTAPCFQVSSSSPPLQLGKACQMDSDCEATGFGDWRSTLGFCDSSGRCAKRPCTQNSDCPSGICADGNCASIFIEAHNHNTCCDIHGDTDPNHLHNACYAEFFGDTIPILPGAQGWPLGNNIMTYHSPGGAQVAETYTLGQRDRAACFTSYRADWGLISKAGRPNGAPCSLRPGATVATYGQTGDTRTVPHGACASGVCRVSTTGAAGFEITQAVCVASTCDDGVVGREEAGADCGGVCSTPCETGRVCHANSDCETGICSNERCQPSCSDGFRNGTELGQDEGGSGSVPECGDRPFGETCRFTSDCVQGFFCRGTGDCVTALDCPINQGAPCASDDQCNGGRCVSQTSAQCAATTCSTNADCSFGVCDAGTGRCECSSDNDCPGDDFCVITNGVCADECIDGRCLGRCQFLVVPL